jgi:hypothetical protein
VAAEPPRLVMPPHHGIHQLRMPIGIRLAFQFGQGGMDLDEPLLRLLTEQFNQFFLKIVFGLFWFGRHSGALPLTHALA